MSGTADPHLRFKSLGLLGRKTTARLLFRTPVHLGRPVRKKPWAAAPAPVSPARQNAKRPPGQKATSDCRTSAPLRGGLGKPWPWCAPKAESGATCHLKPLGLGHIYPIHVSHRCHRQRQHHPGGLLMADGPWRLNGFNGGHRGAVWVRGLPAPRPQIQNPRPLGGLQSPIATGAPLPPPAGAARGAASSKRPVARGVLWRLGPLARALLAAAPRWSALARQPHASRPDASPATPAARGGRRRPAGSRCCCCAAWASVCPLLSASLVRSSQTGRSYRPR
jgi:hypothetical protein